jgi:DNA-binding NarL/FixJ family response regulator
VAPEPVRVVIADDHPFYREGMARLLRRSGIDVVAEVPNAEAAIRAVKELSPDVVVMDLNMPGMSGLEATEHLARRSPDSRVLILSVSAQEPDLIDTLLAGARGYVLKDGPVEEVISGIRAASVDECFISPRLANVLLQRTQGSASDDPGAVRLTSREYEVLGFLALGKASDEISEMIGGRSDVVRGHIMSILTKLQADIEERAAARAARGRRP